MDTILLCIYAWAGNARASGRVYPRVTMHKGACVLEVWHRMALCSESVGMSKRSAGVKAEAKATGMVVMKVFVFIF